MYANRKLRRHAAILALNISLIAPLNFLLR